MTIDIDKLRAAHAATGGLTDCVAKTFESDPYRSRAIMSGCLVLAECNGSMKAEEGDFIALAHNEFPAMLDEIERLRNAEKTEHDRRLAVETVLVNLLCVINDDKDGGFFICAEAKDRIEDAQDVMGVAK